MSRLFKEIIYFFIRNSIILGILILLLFLPLLLQNQYILRIIILIGIYIILTSSLNLIVGYTGIYGIGHVAFYGIGAYTSAIIVMKTGVPVWAGIVFAALVAGVCGQLIGRLTLRLKEKLFVALVSLGFSIIVMLIFLNWMRLTNGPLGISGIPAPVFNRRPFKTLTPYYYYIFFLDCIIIFLLSRLVNSRFGRALKAIREDELAAAANGINTSYYKIAAFTIAAAMAGIAGGFFSHYIRFISPDSFWFMESFVMLAMLVFGGRGNLFGPIAGVVTLISLTEMFRIFDNYRMIIYGTLLIFTMLFRKEGLMGGREFSLKIKWPPEKEKVFTVGDRFLDIKDE